MYQHAGSEMNALTPFRPETAATLGAPAQSLGSVIVPCTRLDTFCARHRVTRIDVLKIGAQRAEGRILREASAFDLLERPARRRPTIVRRGLP